MPNHTDETVLSVHFWTDNLFSFRITRNANYKFTAGQFSRIGLFNDQQQIIWRPYSILTSEQDSCLEYYSVIVPSGEFTQMLKMINVSDRICLDEVSYGFLVLNRLLPGKHLWLLSTGTGLSPFISMLYDINLWSSYDKVVLVHCVRYAKELAYADLINSFYTGKYAPLVEGKFHYVRCVTQEQSGADLYGRIPNLISSNVLQDHVGCNINPEDSRIMLCGNPAMVSDTRGLLSSNGFKLSRKGQPGNMAVESYW
jgi:ferredoxin--NADP+ reductase